MIQHVWKSRLFFSILTAWGVDGWMGAVGEEDSPPLDFSDNSVRVLKHSLEAGFPYTGLSDLLFSVTQYLNFLCNSKVSLHYIMNSLLKSCFIYGIL